MQKDLRGLVIEKIKSLDKNEKLHVFYVFKQNDISYTKNTNGVFINLETIDNTKLQKIYDSIILIEQKKNLMNQLDNKRTVYMEYYKNLIDLNRLKLEEKTVNDYLSSISIGEDDYFIEKDTVNVTCIDACLEDDTTTSIEFFENYKIYDKQYPKDSVYNRLLQKMRVISKKKSSFASYTTPIPISVLIDKECETIDSGTGTNAEPEGLIEEHDIDIDVDIDVEVEQNEWYE